MKKEIAQINSDAQTRQMEGFARVMEKMVDVLDRNAGKAHAAAEGEHAAMGGNAAEED